jgi:hypothetical protein
MHQSALAGYDMLSRWLKMLNVLGMPLTRLRHLYSFGGAGTMNALVALDMCERRTSGLPDCLAFRPLDTSNLSSACKYHGNPRAYI